MHRVARGVCFALLAAGLFCVSCSVTVHGRNVRSGYSFDREGVERSQSDQGPLHPKIRSVVIANRFGTVRVEVSQGIPGWDWQATCWGRNAQDAQRCLEKMELRFTEDDGNAEFEVILPSPSKRLRGLQSDLTVRVPAQVRVEVTNEFGSTNIQGIHGGTTVVSAHGGVELNDLDGTVDVRTTFATIKASDIPGGRLATTHGAIVASNVDGDLTVKASFGRIEINTVAGTLQVENQHGAVDVKNVSKHAHIKTSFGAMHLENARGGIELENQHGSIQAEDIAGDITAECSFGPIKLTDANASNVHLRNKHGSIHVEITGRSLAKLDAKTSFAPLKVTLPSKCDPALRADTSFGTVHSAWPVNAAEEHPEGAPRVQLKNSHGAIHVDIGKGTVD